MRTLDRRGVPVSTHSNQALERYESALSLAVGFTGDPLSVIDQAIAEEPDFVMGHCLRAGLLAIGTEKAAIPALRASVEAAESLSTRANERERGHIAALRAWLDGDFERAVATWGRVLVLWPRDLLALLLAHQGDFLLGHSQWLRDRIAQVLPEWSEQVPGYGFVLGMHAFGLEETGAYDRAEQTGRRAVEINPRDAWGVHAVAHVMEMQGRQHEGIGWLTTRMPDWAVENGLAYHNYWHLALYHMDLGNLPKALELYDQAIRPRPSQVVMEMVDASSLLWRLHLRGRDAGARWKSLCESWEPLIEDAHYAFNDVHAMMAFTGGGQDSSAQRLLATLEQRARTGAHSSTNAMMTREVGLPICRALHAFQAGRYTTAVDLLLKVRPAAHRFGGSHAQRDVLHLTLLEAALRDGQYELVRAIAAERIDLKPASPFNWMVRSRAEGLLGQSARSDSARVQVDRLQRSRARQRSTTHTKLSSMST